LSPQKTNSKKNKRSKSSNSGPTEESSDYVRVRLPNKKKGEIFGIADQLLGASHIKVMCADGKSRMARIPGKMKKRMWIREGDLIILRPWSFQDEKADVIWRYTKTQASYLSRKKMIPDIINIF
jgi:translation initiation factor 1A